ncbi:EpsG family protein [Cruoricaptor ignavus]|uniref:EpsG family protein n=1 Tax=Cruoricaptor ignavus TaxID=1118202 RepID=A0A7M1T0Y1_9FLAO|nr:EpsG family protein [Cruoricaptor ignavus]QOR73445.1 EpsG family protein [Cruoricaptor ignavus]
MQILHPVFTVSVLFMMAFSVMEGYQNQYKNYKEAWFVIMALILFSGFRMNAGADYGSYTTMYQYYGLTATYPQILEGATFKTTDIEVEWLFVLIGKVFFDLGMPFHYFSFFIAIISIIPKFYSFQKNSVYPALSWLLYMFPQYFTSDAGQIRQGVAMGLVFLSLEFIKQRRLIPFLIVIYLSMSFHKSSVIFIPAYWFVRYNFNSRSILTVILICMALSPLKLFNYMGFLNSVAPEEIYAGYTDYIALQHSRGGVMFTDLLCLLYTYFLVMYDKQACAKIPYYEYGRNLTVAGICIYFIMRGSPIFSSRLTSIYLVFSAIALPNAVAAVGNLQMRRYLYTTLLAFVVFYYFVYAEMQADKANYTPGSYRNFIWS